MEPSDFDKILKSKIAEPNDLHEKEMDSAKPFIWAEVQKEIKGNRSLRWYHLAAAVLLLLISFSIVMYSVQNAHQKQLMMLSDKIDLIQSNHQQQIKQLSEQNTELSMVVANQERARDEQPEKTPPIVEKVIYQTDTVFIRQVEYIELEPEPKPITVRATDHGPEVASNNHPEIQNDKYDEIIYPANSKQVNDRKSESSKLKISAFTARRN